MPMMESISGSSAKVSLGRGGIMPSNEPAPTPDVQDRMVITESYISLQVENVTNSIDEIKKMVKEKEGYVVNTYLSRPEFGEEATVQIRVPTESIDEILSYLRSNSVKVVTENISGQDITDEYVDIEERIRQLERNKERLEGFLDTARNVDEIMKILPQIQSLQNQIDSYVGRIQYLEGASSTSLITIYLSTDELSLPYAPVKSWRPDAIFKQATRSLIVSLQKLGTFTIWLGVYSVLIVPAITLVLIVVTLVKRRRQQ